MYGKAMMVAVAVLVGSGAVMAQESAERHLETAVPTPALEQTWTVDWTDYIVSQYMWRGFNVLGDHGALQPSLTLTHNPSGLSLNVWGSTALESGDEFRDLDEVDYTATWSKSFFENCCSQLDFHFNYIYYSYPHADTDVDTHELGLGVSWPQLCPLGPGYLVPSWYVGRLWKADEEGPEGGWFNIFGLAYDLPIKPLLACQEKQSLSFGVDLTHNNGAFGVESGFSAATANLSTDFEWKWVTVTPSIHYQWSIEKTVDPENEFWAGVQLGHTF